MGQPSNAHTTRRAPHRAGTLRLLALALSAATARAACKATTLDFMLLEDDSSHAAIEADIRDDLAKIGITVTARPVDKDTFNTDMVAGNYDMVFSKTWGVTTNSIPTSCRFTVVNGLLVPSPVVENEPVRKGTSRPTKIFAS